MKIIREYGLFTIEEDDYFMPAELNPVKKRGGKAEKIVPQDAVSEQENGEKSKKTSKEIDGKRSEKNRKTLNNGYLANYDLNNKENIKDITTTATEEKEETAAAATASKSSSDSPAGSDSPAVSVSPNSPDSSNSPAATVSPKPSAVGGQQPPLPPQTSFTVPNHALHRPQSVSLGELRCVIRDTELRHFGRQSN